MKQFTGFEHGMGIGGWLTNYKRFNVLPEDRRLCLTVGDMEHFSTLDVSIQNLIPTSGTGIYYTNVPLKIAVQ